MPDLEISRGTAIILLILVVVGIAAAGFLLLGTHEKGQITNITIREKYSEDYHYGRIIDTNGNIYQVRSQRLWAKFEINTTYQIRFYNGGAMMMGVYDIDAMYDEKEKTWWYF